MPVTPQYSTTIIPFEEAIAQFRQKLQIPTEEWRDMQGAIHAKAFTIAGATQTALLNDFYQAVDKTIAAGDTLADFRKQFDSIVAKHGWSYKGKRGWRTNVIYQNNKNTARAAGRWDQQQRTKKTRPYLLYTTAQDARVRPDHQRWHYILLPIDHPFWVTHYPPNGWNCRCQVISLSQRDIDRQGLKITDPSAVDLSKIKTTDTVTGEVLEKFPGVDLGWDYNPGIAWIAPDVALGRELVKLPPTARKPAIQAFNSKMLDQEPAYKEWLTQVVADPTSTITKGARVAVGHMPEEAIVSLYMASLTPASTAIMITGTSAAALAVSSGTTLPALMQLIANATESRYDSATKRLILISAGTTIELVLTGLFYSVASIY